MSPRGVFRRYLLFQVPGWVVAAGLCALATRWPGLSPVTAALLFAAWVGKDFALYPLVGQSYARPADDAHGSLVGGTGVVERTLDPTGWVRVRGELWRARVEGGAAAVEKGARVRVIAAEGMTIIVGPV